MARASVIWLVKAPIPLSMGCFTAMATFTVKHECKRWLTEEDRPETAVMQWVVERMTDGPPTGDINKSWYVKEFLVE